MIFILEKKNGGTFIQFKLGVTCVNTPNPNGPDAFDDCLTVDDPDPQKFKKLV